MDESAISESLEGGSTAVGGAASPAVEGNTPAGSAVLDSLSPSEGLAEAVRPATSGWAAYGDPALDRFGEGLHGLYENYGQRAVSNEFAFDFFLGFFTAAFLYLCYRVYVILTRKRGLVIKLKDGTKEVIDGRAIVDLQRIATRELGLPKRPNLKVRQSGQGITVEARTEIFEYQKGPQIKQELENSLRREFLDKHHLEVKRVFLTVTRVRDANGDGVLDTSAAAENAAVEAAEAAPKHPEAIRPITSAAVASPRAATKATVGSVPVGAVGGSTERPSPVEKAATPVSAESAALLAAGSGLALASGAQSEPSVGASPAAGVLLAAAEPKPVEAAEPETASAPAVAPAAVVEEPASLGVADAASLGDFRPKSTLEETTPESLDDFGDIGSAGDTEEDAEADDHHQRS